MRFLLLFVLAFAAAAALVPAPPRTGGGPDEDFVRASPTLGDALPDLTVYTPDGSEVKTSDLRGHYAVLTFGCLT
jgi:cytochrome oxidase Cu insertion factor (SCO1/SenC/PrrC family)